MILTEKKMKAFFPDDNRFLYFVAKKNGLFFLSDDDVETARYFAIKNVMRMFSSKFEFEDETHMNALMERNFKHAIFSMMSHNEAKKRSMDIRTESEFAIEGKDTTPVLERKGGFEDPYKDETFNHLMHKIYTTQPKEVIIIFDMYLQGYTNVEVARVLDISPEAVRQRREKVIKKIRKSYEVDKKHCDRDVQEIQPRVRNRPARTYTAKQSDYTEAMSYLGFEEEI